MNLPESDLDKYFNVLELMFHELPYVFWKDKEGRYRGGNQNQADNLGFASPANFIGKTIFQILKDQASAKAIEDADQKVMHENKTLTLEEKMITPLGEKFYLSQKSPIHGEGGEVIGLLGLAMDITELKKQEQAIKEERDRLVKIAAQVAHDIASPLASLKMMLDVCNELPEKKLSILKAATENILDIANNMLTNYSTAKKSAVTDVEARQPLLVSDFLAQLLSTKKLEYRNQLITLKTAIEPDAQFAFINTQKTELRRSLSNLVNNAVDALSNLGNGAVTVGLKVEPTSVIVEVKDNGKGMPVEMVKKLEDQRAFTEGKENGHGLGLQQVREMLEYNQGIMEVESTLQKGTVIRLTFPRIEAADWIVQKIELRNDSMVVILDDEESIHGAWDLHFNSLSKSHPNLALHHFTQGGDVLNFFNNLGGEERGRAIFLSDYELHDQPQNGLEIIRAGQIENAILVTSHYANPKVRKASNELGIKILPKQMASVVPIRVNNGLRGNLA